jgi:hypothetical protein
MSKTISVRNLPLMNQEIMYRITLFAKLEESFGRALFFPIELLNMRARGNFEELMSLGFILVVYCFLPCLDTEV